MLLFNNLDKTFHVKRGSVEELKNISLELNDGEFMVVNAPSGCGKTTFLLIAGSLLHPTDEEISIDGQNRYKMNQTEGNQPRANTIGFVFQQFHLIPYLSIRENILSPALASVNHYSND